MSLVAGLELKVFNSATLSGTYQNLGTALTNRSYSAVFSNESDVSVLITSDGSTDQIRLSPGQILPLNYYDRADTVTAAGYVFRKGTQLKIKQVTAPGTGDIIVNILTAA